MAIVKGLKELKEQLSETKNSGDISGYNGELEVVKALEQHLPDDNIIIIQPEIGSASPDILIISPDYGFRIVEVKNWKLNNMEQVEPNGTIKMKNHTSIDNPKAQVRKHVDALNTFLKDTYGLPDQFRNIGYLVVFSSIKKNLFIRKFEQTLNSWRDKDTYFKHYIFQNQLSSNSLIKIIENAVHFDIKKNNFKLNKNQIEKIVESTHFQPKNYNHDELVQLINFKFQEMKKGMTELDSNKIVNETSQLINNQLNEIVQNDNSLKDIDKRFTKIETLLKNTNKNDELHLYLDKHMSEVKQMVENIQNQKTERVIQKNETIDKRFRRSPKESKLGVKTILGLTLIASVLFMLFRQTLSDNSIFSSSSQADNQSITEVNSIGKIKGNINEQGEKIYHVPGDEYYEITKISLENGEQYFDTEEEALEAGFRPAGTYVEVTPAENQVPKSTASSNNSYTITATVVKFSFDSTTGTKYLILSDGVNEIDAIIFEDTQVPYINENDVYTFNGYMQKIDDLSIEELVVTSIE